MDEGGYIMDEDDVYAYGPDPEIITDILEDSDYVLRVSPHERALITEHDGGYEVFCSGIPPGVFEDQIAQLFDRKLKNTVKIRLPMDPSTDEPKGYALITYSRIQDAERAVQQLNNYEIKPGHSIKVGLSVPDQKRIQLKNLPPEMNFEEILEKASMLTEGLQEVVDGGVGNCVLVYVDENFAGSARETLAANPFHRGAILDFAKATDHKEYCVKYRKMLETVEEYGKDKDMNLERAEEMERRNEDEERHVGGDFPCEENDTHLCIHSSFTNYCTCIKQMIADISSLAKDIRQEEQNGRDERIEKLNKLQCACHSLLMEDIQAIPENVAKILDASEFAVDQIENASLDYILKIHEMINPEDGMFRTSDVFIFGLYGGRTSCLVPQPPAAELVIPEMEKVVELIKSSLSPDDEEALILMAMTASVDFVLTHPFYDGNGRCSRVIFGSILRLYGFPWVTIPVTDTVRYYEAIASVRDKKNYTLIYRFLCACIRRSMKVYLKNLQSLRYSQPSTN